MAKRNKITTLTDHLKSRYGEIGTKKRNAFEIKSTSFIIGEMLKEARQAAKITQDQLAHKAGTKKSYISRLEHGKIDIQISTLFRIFEEGLGRTINFSIH